MLEKPGPTLPLGISLCRTRLEALHPEPIFFFAFTISLNLARKKLVAELKPTQRSGPADPSPFSSRECTLVEGSSSACEADALCGRFGVAPTLGRLHGDGRILTFPCPLFSLFLFSFFVSFFHPTPLDVSTTPL